MAKRKEVDGSAGRVDGTQRIHNIIVGTAGHIDHGKTALIERLTGIDADRLPEEKQRGMTIDLGFARYEISGGRQVGIIDVPGHERFIKNMVAGATGIDIVLLVVAADDGVMPQTREHLEIMEILGLQNGIVVVTKRDLVDEELLELAMDDVRETIRGTFLENAPMVAVSSITGEGIDNLRPILNAMIEAVPRRKTEGLFRMPVQRVFSSKGFGTVLTGIPITGSAVPGETLEVLPLGETGRVRSIQAYMSVAEKAQAGQSSAVNISDVEYKRVSRGMVLATPGFFRSASMIEARLRYLPKSSRPLRHLTHVRFHCGTAEVLGQVYLLEGRVCEPGESMYVQIRLEEPIVTVAGDRFVLRLHSPMITIGGGEILDLSRWRLKRGKEFVIEGLQGKERALDSPRDSLLIRILDRGYDAFQESQLARDGGLSPEETSGILIEMRKNGQVFESSRAGLLISTQRFEEAQDVATTTAREFFRNHPRRLLMAKIALRQAVNAHDVFFQDLLVRLEADRKIRVVRGEYLQWAFHTPKLSQAESKFRKALAEALENAPFTPPRVDEVARGENFPADQAAAIAALLIEEGVAVKIADDVYLHQQAIDDARERLRAHLETSKQMTASEAREILQSSRKYVIPLLEFLDNEGFTIRRGDVRELRGAN
jgi:selenocysteine-specific elongation factor